MFNQLIYYIVSRGSIKKPMSMSRLEMVLQQAGFQSKRIGKARTRGHPFPKTIYTRVCVRVINKGVRRSTRPPKNFRLLRRMLCGKTSFIRSDVIRHPPYNCLITAYLRPIYGSKPRYDRDVTATST